jgi:hypothetical protein
MLDRTAPYGVAQTAATLAALLDIAAPQGAAAPLDLVLQAAKRRFDGQPADRLLLYNPDAVALWLYEAHTPLFTPVQLRTELTLPLHSVMPTVTPVCFASMYTGLEPACHGIQAYVKPVLQVETLFDTLLFAGRRPAIVSTEGDSISSIFLKRQMDYFIYPTPEDCNRKAAELLRADRHDLIVVYNGDYDAAMHRHGPEGAASLAALARNAEAFAMLTDTAAQAWAGRHRGVTAFAPDHGCHAIDGGLGSHGLDMSEDMNIVHFYGFL